MLLLTEVSDGDAVFTLWGRGRRARATVRRVALKTLLLLAKVSYGDAVITLWGWGRHGAPRRVNCVRTPKAAMVTKRVITCTTISCLLDAAAENMEVCGEISFLRCICSNIIIMQYHTNRGCTVVDQVCMLDRNSSGSGF